ncbi:MAG TPA: AraC family transcriptional regulator [Cyclobacteriaceae bacterium]|jgi:AraC-like DNA-binding protein|nr:AraC family transcriptional regulator [Cyclobacteriaceae bacterium]
MSKNEDIVIYENLYNTYKNLGLSVEGIDESKDFTINNLADIHKSFPFKSTVFRPSYFSFVFVKDGHGKYTTDDLTFDTEPGTIYFTNPGHHKAFEWFDMKELYLITLSESFLKENVHPEIFEEFPFLLAETVRPRTLTQTAFAEFENLYLQILKEYNSSSPYKNRIIGNLFVVLLLKIKEYFWADYNPIYEGNRSSQIVKTFKENLEKHYRDLAGGKVQVLFQVQDYAKLQSLNPNYLSNVIKSKTGQSISNWISDKTIAEAKSLLKNSSISIKQIAFQLGFSESNHFSNYFKKHTNFTPNAFRKA